MVTVVGVKFKNAGKVYYFDPGIYQVKLGTDVIVETARGTEFGTVTMAPREVEPSQVVSPLKKIIRVANERDHNRYQENQDKRARARKICQEKIEKHKLEMKLIEVEYTFDNNKVIFYFTADGRVDFRELVKDLAAVFKMRIELRQVGVRDEARMLGGVGSCGKALCCGSFLSDFEPVSIKMAKVQNLPLNPTKISGTCGRLMCCLKYENDLYMEMRKGMPNVGERIKTPDGTAVVFESNILENKIKSRLVLEEATKEQPEKLSTEYYTYGKEEIQRSKYSGNNQKKKRPTPEKEAEEIDGQILEEMGDLLKD